MSKNIARVMVIYILAVICAHAQLYLITGSPTPDTAEGFASSIFQVASNSSLKLVQDVVDADPGAAWITISYDLRKAIVVTRSARYRVGDMKVIVIDLDSAKVVKSCLMPDLPMSLIHQFIAALPLDGAQYLQYLSGDTEGLLRAMSLDDSVACEASFAARPEEDLRFITPHGRSGVAELGSVDWGSTHVDAEGRIYGFLSARKILFDTRIPPSMLSSTLIQGTRRQLLISNKQVSAIGVFEPSTSSTSPGKQYLICCLKSRGNCRNAPVPAESVSWVRGFGKYIAVVEARPKRPVPGSTVRVDSRKADPRVGTDTQKTFYRDWRFESSDSIFPGRLYLYDVDSGQVLTIVTKETDSEVILVENETVYYRVNDSLFAASITSKGIEGTRLLAKSEAVRDAHWAFISKLQDAVE